jgi:2-oxoisovalerate dehydrogenase E1 component
MRKSTPASAPKAAVGKPVALTRALAPAPRLDPPGLRQAYQTSVLIRAFEQRLLDLFSQGLLVGTTHTCIGQEANAVGVCAALQAEDIVVSNHRGHGHFIAATGLVDELMAEVMGRATGVCGGWGGSQHLCVPRRFYSNGIQGGIVPLALGLALAEKRRGSNLVSVFVGDGTFGEGALHEALNIAAVRSAPLLMVVEDNGIAQTTPTERTMAGSIAARTEALGIRTSVLTYPTVDEVYECTAAAAAYVRSDAGGPAVIVIKSARLGPHSKGDDTRDEAFVEALKTRDPLVRTGESLPASVRDQAWLDAKFRVDLAYERARKAPEPVLPETEPSATAEFQQPSVQHAATARHLDELSGKTMRELLNGALHQLMAADKQLHVIGEDIVDPYGGAFKVTAGLSTKFPARVFEMPISEQAIVGLAGGMAMRGTPVIAEIMFGDFLCLAMDQLVNHLSRYRPMYNDQVRVPVIVRTPMGGRRGYGPTHSQTLDARFLGIGGLTVLAPSPLHPIPELLFAALSTGNPTLLIENKWAYGYRVQAKPGAMVGDFFVHKSGPADGSWLSLSLTAFADEAVTLMCYGGMVPIVMEAAEKLLLEHEISARIVAPSKLSPFDKDGLLALCSADRPLLVVEEGAAAFGFGAEVLANVAIARSNQRVARLGATGPVIGAAHSLENASLPTSRSIIQAVQKLLQR